MSWFNKGSLRSSVAVIHEVEFHPGLRIIFFSTLGVFVFQLIAGYWWGGCFSDTIDAWFAFSTSSLERVWTFLSYAWMHDISSLSHFGWNMAYLCVFGVILENRLGTKRFLWFYILAAIAGIAAFWATADPRPRGLVGASGAVTACVVLGALSWPNDTVRILLVHVRPWWLATAWIVRDLFGFITADHFGFGGVAHSCRLGGAVAAVAYDRFWLTGFLGALPQRTKQRPVQAPTSVKAPWWNHLQFSLWRFRRALRPVTPRLVPLMPPFGRLLAHYNGDRERAELIIRFELRAGSKDRPDADVRALQHWK